MKQIRGIFDCVAIYNFQKVLIWELNIEGFLKLYNRSGHLAPLSSPE